MHLPYKHHLGSHFASWTMEVIQKDYMGNPVYDKEAEVDHSCLITLNVMCVAMTATHETFRPCCLKIGGG